MAAHSAEPLGAGEAANGAERMIGPIVAILVFIAAGLGLSAWSILRRASRGKVEHLASASEEAHFAIGIETQVEIPGQGPA
jgi:hypothetical protein